MPVARFSCPECDAVLRPTKPVPEGKRVKCPKCGAGFTVPGAPREAIAPKPVAPRPKAAAAKKKPIKDDDEGGTYGFSDEPANQVRDGEEEKVDKGDLSFKTDDSVKDPRGPAQAAVVKPSNWLLITGAIGAFAWLILIVLILIPAAFPPVSTDEEEDNAKDAKPKSQLPKAVEMSPGAGAEGSDKPLPTEPPNRYEPEVAGAGLFKLVGLSFLIDIPKVFAFLLLVPIALACLYGCAIVAGAVKIQSLESRTWGKVASIMVMVPINAGGLMLVFNSGLWQFMSWFSEGDEFTAKAMRIGVVALVYVCEISWGIRVGIWNLQTLARPEVIEGFEFEPE